jgi:hypothetical protein
MCLAVISIRASLWRSVAARLASSSRRSVRARDAGSGASPHVRVLSAVAEDQRIISRCFVRLLRLARTTQRRCGDVVVLGLIERIVRRLEAGTNGAALTRRSRPLAIWISLRSTDPTDRKRARISGHRAAHAEARPYSPRPNLNRRRAAAVARSSRRVRNSTRPATMRKSSRWMRPQSQHCSRKLRRRGRVHSP